MFLYNAVIHVFGGEESQSLRLQFYKSEILKRISDSLMMPFNKQEWKKYICIHFFL